MTSILHSWFYMPASTKQYTRVLVLEYGRLYSSTNFIIIYLSAQVSHGLQFAPEVLYNQVLSKVRNYHRRAPS